MKFNNKESEYELSTGRKFYANNGIIGLSGRLILKEGYDGSVEYEHYELDNETSIFTKKEKREIADFMIELFNQWVNK